MRICLAACALVLIASVGASSQDTHSYVGLFADDVHLNQTRVWYTGTDTQFDAWVWWLPSARGLHAVTLQLSFPSNVIPGEITLAPGTEGLTGCNDGVGPYCAMFLYCPSDWVWSHRRSCILITDEKSMVQIVGTPEATSCDPGYPAEPLIIMPYIFLNLKIAVEPQAWGAIKSLF